MASGSDNPEILLAQAEKKMSSSGGFFASMLTPPNQRFEDAYELYQQAANAFKLNKNWDRAGFAYTKGAQCQLKMGIKFEAGTCYLEAANMYKKVDAKASVDCLNKATMMFQELGKFNIAAKHALAAGEMYESQIVDLNLALERYEKAVEYSEMEDSGSAKNKPLIKIATISAQLENYERAFTIYEELAKSMADNALLKWSAKEYFLKAGLCRLCSGDALGAKAHTDEYPRIYAGFRDSREFKLLTALCAAVEEKDVDAYTAVVTEYDTISPLDDWMTAILLRIKKGMSGSDLL